MQTIRDNPIPAAMAAFGIGWLVTHRSEAPTWDRGGWPATGRGYKTADVRRSWNTRGGSWRDVGDGGRSGNGDGGPQQDLGSAAGARIGEVAENVQDRAGQIGDRFGGDAGDNSRPRPRRSAIRRGA